ncbi:MAG: YceI family protein [Anaerolineae bacterium]
MAWIIDPAHTHISFSVRHMMISTVRGEFEKFSGTVDFDEDNPAATTVDVTVDVASINTRSADRDNHLRSPDFFDAAEHPTMTFKSKRVEVLDEDRAKLIGDLTIRGVTREIVLDVTYTGQAKSPWGTVSAGFTASGTINRTDWGLVWNQALETGGVLVGETVTIALEVELIQQGEAEAAAG